MCMSRDGDDETSQGFGFGRETCFGEGTRADEELEIFLARILDIGVIPSM